MIPPAKSCNDKRWGTTRGVPHGLLADVRPWERSSVRRDDVVLVQHGIARRAREDRCSPRHVVRGTVPMTAHLLRRRRTGARVVATRAPLILVTPAGYSVELPHAVPLMLWMFRPIARQPASPARCAVATSRCLGRRCRPAGCHEGDRDELGDIRRVSQYRSLRGA